MRAASASFALSDRATGCSPVPMVLSTCVRMSSGMSASYGEKGVRIPANEIRAHSRVYP